jgi:hypothetical protein
MNLQSGLQDIETLLCNENLDKTNRHWLGIISNQIVLPAVLPEKPEFTLLALITQKDQEEGINSKKWDRITENLVGYLQRTKQWQNPQTPSTPQKSPNSSPTSPRPETFTITQEPDKETS